MHACMHKYKCFASFVTPLTPWVAISEQSGETYPRCGSKFSISVGRRDSLWGAQGGGSVNKAVTFIWVVGSDGDGDGGGGDGSGVARVMVVWK